MHIHQEVRGRDSEEYPARCRTRRVAKGVFECLDKRTCPFAIGFAEKQLCMDPFSNPQSRLNATGMTLEFEPFAFELLK